MSFYIKSNSKSKNFLELGIYCILLCTLVLVLIVIFFQPSIDYTSDYRRELCRLNSITINEVQIYCADSGSIQFTDTYCALVNATVIGYEQFNAKFYRNFDERASFNDKNCSFIPENCKDSSIYLKNQLESRLHKLFPPIYSEFECFISVNVKNSYIDILLYAPSKYVYRTCIGILVFGYITSVGLIIYGCKNWFLKAKTYFKNRPHRKWFINLMNQVNYDIPDHILELHLSQNKTNDIIEVSRDNDDENDDDDYWDLISNKDRKLSAINNQTKIGKFYVNRVGYPSSSRLSLTSINSFDDGNTRTRNDSLKSYDVSPAALDYDAYDMEPITEENENYLTLTSLRKIKKDFLTVPKPIIEIKIDEIPTNLSG